ncbi:unnamed protein product [Toxocara canis]|uniref:Rhs family protein n=1 Tax=Toxocara canis TaxID=6265 RepID=A0A183TZF6_TOXCA|nr:unnamed protein product [Toxocara canis]
MKWDGAFQQIQEITGMTDGYENIDDYDARAMTDSANKSSTLEEGYVKVRQNSAHKRHEQLGKDVFAEAKHTQALTHINAAKNNGAATTCKWDTTTG